MAMSGAKVNNPGLGAVNQDMVILTLDSEDADKVLNVIALLVGNVSLRDYQYGDVLEEFSEMLAELSDAEPIMTRLASEESAES